MARIQIGELETNNSEILSELTYEEALMISGGGIFGSIWKDIKSAAGFIFDNGSVSISKGGIKVGLNIPF